MKKKLTVAVASVGVLVVMIMYLTGVFTSGRIYPTGQLDVTGEPWRGIGLTISPEEITDTYLGVGTVRSTTQSIISGQVNGNIVAVSVMDGDRVSKGQKLLKVDDREAMTMLREAEKGLEASKIAKQQAGSLLLQAQAQYSQAIAGKRMAEQAMAQAEQSAVAAEENARRAKSEFLRVEELFKKGSESPQNYEAMKATYVAAEAQAEQARIAIKTADAGIRQAEESVKASAEGVNQASSGIEVAGLGIERAEQVLERARIAFSYTEVVSPADGFIGQTFVETGDLVFPGKPLVEFYSRDGFEVVTYAREALFDKVRVGDRLEVRLESLNKTVEGLVKEVVPSADPVSRTFMVKVSIPKDDRFLPGMFARVAIPVEKRMAILIPPGAVKRVGMIETVVVRDGDLCRVRYIRLGRMYGNRIEVISGLHGGEVVSLGEAE